MPQYEITIVETSYAYTTYLVSSDLNEKQLEEEFFFGDYSILDDQPEVRGDWKQGEVNLHQIEKLDD